MAQKMRLLDVIRTINTSDDKEEVNRLIRQLFSINYIERPTIVGADTGMYSETINMNDDIIEYRWNYPQLQRIYSKNIYNFCSIENINKGKIHRHNLEINDVFSIMLDNIYIKVKKESFIFGEGDIGEAKLVTYLKNVIEKRCIDKFNEINKFIIKQGKDGLKLCSYDTLKDNGLETKEMGDKYDGYNNLFVEEFDYNENYNKIENLDLDENRFLSWIKFHWDPLTIMTGRNLNIRKTNREEYNEELKAWRDWATKKQCNKLKILIEYMEGIEEVDGILQLKKYEDGNYMELVEQKNNGYGLVKKNVGLVLFPNRKNNSNKDIDNLTDRLKNRFTRHLNKIDKSHLEELVC